MNIKLISKDNELASLCREVLAELPGHSSSLTAVGVEDAGGESDLCIWDFEPNLSISDLDPQCTKHLFLVHRKDLSNFHKRAAGHEANILLKPVTRAALTAFLGQALSSRTASFLRADRDEILQCLIQTNLRLQEYDHDRTNFLARAVHDFRAPLTALSGYCGLLLGEPLGALNENQREVLQRMHNSARRLSRMASAMFQLSVGRQVKRRPDLQKGDLQECLNQSLHEITPYADEKRISITPDLDPCNEDLYFETDQIEQVLVNVLDNACKFTPRGGAIEIRGYPFFWERRAVNSAMSSPIERRRHNTDEVNSYRIDIRDSGPSIPEEHLHRIFEEYTSYAGGRDRSGGGLGLAICRMIISQHGGRVWAENTELGPMFSFVLPIYRFESHSNAEKEHERPLKYAGAGAQ